MNGAEKLLRIMRQQGAAENPPKLQLGEMLSDTMCRVAGNALGKEDLMVAEHLTLEYELTTSAVISAMINSNEASVNITDQKVRVRNKLKEGDTVLLYRISEDKYVIIEKVVSL